MNPYVFIPCDSCGSMNRTLIERLESGPVCAKCKSKLSPEKPVHLDSANFDTVINSSGLPVLVDFYATWCGPCKQMAPILEEVARKHHESLMVAKVDTEQAPEIAGKYGIRGVPTLILFQNGQERARQVGAVPEQSIEQMINQSRM